MKKYNQILTESLIQHLVEAKSKEALLKALNTILRKDTVTADHIETIMRNISTPIFQKELDQHFGGKLGYPELEAFYSDRSVGTPTKPELWDSIVNDSRYKKDVEKRKAYKAQGGKWIAHSSLLKYKKQQEELKSITTPLANLAQYIENNSNQLFLQQKQINKLIQDIRDPNTNIVSAEHLIKKSLQGGPKVVNIKDSITNTIILNNKKLLDFLMNEYKPKEGGGTKGVGPLEYFLVALDNNTFSSRVKSKENKNNGDVLVKIGGQEKMFELKSIGGGLGSNRYYSNGNQITQMVNQTYDVNIDTFFPKKQKRITDVQKHLNEIIKQLRQKSVPQIQIVNIFDSYCMAMHGVNINTDFKQSPVPKPYKSLKPSISQVVNGEMFEKIWNTNSFQQYKNQEKFDYIGFFDRDTYDLMCIETIDHFYKATAKMKFDGSFSAKGSGDRELKSSTRFMGFI